MSVNIPPDPQLLTRLLAIQPGQSLCIIFDRSGLDIANWFFESAVMAGIPAEGHFFPLLAQQRFSELGFAPLAFERYLDLGGAVVTALSSYDRCTPFRAMLLEIARRAHCQILHLPGVGWDLFQYGLQAFHPEQILPAGRSLQRAFCGVKELMIYSRHAAGEEHILRVPVSGQSLHLDSGVPAPGEIGQLPAGEAYLTPVEYCACGSIVINGSIPGRVLRNGDAQVLAFVDGLADLERSRFSPTAAGQAFIAELAAGSRRNRNNLALGELGFGLNRMIGRLIGEPIHDEKATGTAHIALGCNLPLGGTIGCDLHTDLVFIPDRITLDGHELDHTWGLEN